jgi:hypothetical protein|tara:strand:- start:7010 stop:7270 length:261 start_codon:yes stop_codon:yes gene_type:complete
MFEPETNQITPEFIEEMVDRVISSLTKKLEELDVSMDYIAAALLDTDAIGLGSTQSQRGRMGAPSTSHLTPARAARTSAPHSDSDK